MSDTRVVEGGWQCVIDRSTRRPSLLLLLLLTGRIDVGAFALKEGGGIGTFCGKGQLTSTTSRRSMCGVRRKRVLSIAVVVIETMASAAQHPEGRDRGACFFAYERTSRGGTSARADDEGGKGGFEMLDFSTL